MIGHFDLSPDLFGVRICRYEVTTALSPSSAMWGRPVKWASPPAIAAWCAGCLRLARSPCSAWPRTGPAAVEHAVLGIDRLGIVVGAGIGARRVAGDQIVDFQPVLDGADAVFERGC